MFRERKIDNMNLALTLVYKTIDKKFVIKQIHILKTINIKNLKLQKFKIISSEFMLKDSWEVIVATLSPSNSYLEGKYIRH